MLLSIRLARAGWEGTGASAEWVSAARVRSGSWLACRPPRAPAPSAGGQPERKPAACRWNVLSHLRQGQPASHQQLTRESSSHLCHCVTWLYHVTGPGALAECSAPPQPGRPRGRARENRAHGRAAPCRDSPARHGAGRGAHMLPAPVTWPAAQPASAPPSARLPPRPPLLGRALALSRRRLHRPARGAARRGHVLSAALILAL